MSMVEELERLQQLKDSGTLTEDEFVAAKARIISGPPPSVSTAEVKSLRALVDVNAQISELDSQWGRERERHMMHGRYGRSFKPDRGSAVIGGVVFGLIGIFVFTLACVQGPQQLAIFGILIVIIGIVSAGSTWQKAGEYEHAEATYRRRRSALIASRDKTSNGANNDPNDRKHYSPTHFIDE